MEKVIMISGSTYNAGKDTAGEYLETMYNRNGKRVLKMAFADWVKDSLKRYIGWNGNKDENGRMLMQHYATDVVRAKDPDYWADVTCRLASALQNDYDILIITDLRFPNEYLTMTRYFNVKDIVTVQIVRNIDDNNVLRMHSSENSMTRFYYDYSIENNGSLASLENKLSHLFDTLNT